MLMKNVPQDTRLGSWRRKRRASTSDWAKAAAVTNEELEASADPDEAGMVMDCDSVRGYG